MSGNDLTADAPASSETFVIDNIQPEMIDGQASGGTGTAGAIKIGDDAVFVVSFDEPVINVEAANFTVTGGTIASVVPNAADTAGFSNQWTVTVTPAVVEGDISLDLTTAGTIEDQSGNSVYIDAGAATIIAVDTIAPVAPTVAITTAGSQVVSVVNEQDVANGLVISGTKEAGSSIDIDFASGAHTISVAADESASWSHTLSSGEMASLVSAVGQGVAGSSISYVVTATDAVGNTSTTTASIGIDTIDPSSATVTSHDDASNDSATTYVNNAEDEDGTTLTGSKDADSSVQVSLTGSATSITKDIASDASTSWSLSLTKQELIDLGEGTINYTVNTTDAFGNTTSSAEGSETSGSFVYDPHRPQSANHSGCDRGHRTN